MVSLFTSDQNEEFKLIHSDTAIENTEISSFSLPS